MCRARGAPAEDFTYVVKAGDNPWNITSRYLKGIGYLVQAAGLQSHPCATHHPARHDAAHPAGVDARRASPRRWSNFVGGPICGRVGAVVASRSA